jgi:hypothetical protein
MGGWRTKLIFALIIFFAGFATGIYCLAPVPENQDSKVHEKSFESSVFKSDEFAQSFNAGLHKCIDSAKDTTERVATFIKQKFKERETDD